MTALRTTNPLLNDRVFGVPEKVSPFSPQGMAGTVAKPRSNEMTLQGTINKTFFLLAICIGCGMGTWMLVENGTIPLWPAFMGSWGVGLLLVLIACFAPKTSPFVAPVIGVAEGVFAGCASVAWTAYASAKDGGVVGSLGTGLVLQAGLLTVCIAGGLLLAYSTRLIRPSENFKLGVAAATGGLAMFFLISMALRMFGIHIPYIWENGPIGIAFSAGIVILAALNLVLDFDFIENGSQAGLPKHMEWYAGIGVLVTLVWLYVSLLRLLALLNSRE